MKIFVTGATGFLGKHVAQQSRDHGHEVTALVRTQQYRWLQDLGIQTIDGDLSAVEALAMGVRDADAIVHCASDMNMSAISKQGWSVNAGGVANLITASKQSSIRKFIFVSTANTIKTGTRTRPGDESQLHQITDDDLPYVQSKLLAEQYLIDEFRSSGLPVCILHPTFILGPGHSKSSRLIRAMINNRVMVHTPGNKDIVDVRDVARAIINSLERGRVGERYLISNESISYSELIDIVSNFSGKRVMKMPMPYSFWKVVGYSGTLLGTALNHKTIRMACSDYYYNSAKARRELSFSPRPVHETIRDTVAWIRAQSNGK